jgi:hypothetical protein
MVGRGRGDVQDVQWVVLIIVNCNKWRVGMVGVWI